MSALIVTPTLGVSPWLGDTVASVARQGAGVRHVLVAPATSVAELRERFPSVTVLAEPGGGMYAAINAGVASQTEWDAMGYLNDDDLLLPEFAQVLAALQRFGAEPHFVYGRVKLIDREGRRLGAIPVSRRPADNRALYAERLEPVYQHGTLVNRAAWESVGGFDANFRLCGDSEWLARLCVRGVSGTYVPAEVAAFRLHGGQLTKNRAAMTAERDRVDAKWGLRDVKVSGRRWARWNFRIRNLGVYAERVRRHGWISFDELLTREG